MVSTTQSDTGALEHIVSIILAELPFTADSISFPPYHACFSKAGIANALHFISMEPNAYCSISFAIPSSGDEDQPLNIIQIKKINSLFFW
jgi:hypothetical protein